jgi:uncharacterized 2Fe-2S/4Fe-4S cluster protein (DUF4445 family)
VEYGMRAADGAIERIEIDPETLLPRFRIIGDERWSDPTGGEGPVARGICGSGIIDGVAELFRVGLIGADGRFKTDTNLPNLKDTENGLGYIIAWANQTSIDRDIAITQDDVRQIQLAKAPLYVAAHYLMSSFGIERPDRILLAGGFGSHIDTKHAMLIGMIPDCPLDHVYAVGNSAGDGARIALLNRDKREEARAILKNIQRIELPAQPGFQDQFIMALNFPHMVDPYPHLDGIAPTRHESPLMKKLFGEEKPTIRQS